MSTHFETVIVGGGQAGLAVRYYLSQKNRPHIILEQAEKAGNAWRNHRWDSFTLNTPNWQSAYHLWSASGASTYVYSDAQQNLEKEKPP